MNTKHFIILGLITVIAFLLRFVGLSNYPPSLTIDEVNHAYSAYSVLRTGKDEWGYFMPASFKEKGDYTAPTLVYLTVPSIAIFGLNEFATRFPVALFSVITVPILFFLLKKHIFTDNRVWISLLATFLLATSSWHIVFSRSDFEAVIALTFTLINIIYLFRFLKSSSLLDLFLAGLFAFISMVTYNSNRIFIPLIDLSFFAINFHIFWNNLQNLIKKNRNSSILVIIIFIVLTIFYAQNYIFGPGAARAKMVFFSVDFDFARALMDDINKVGLGFYRPVLLLFFWCKRFLEYFSANFYLYSGLDLIILGQPGAGVANLVIYPFFILGMLLLLTVKKFSFIDKKQLLFVFTWLLIGFTPASLANNSQQPLRSLNSVIGLIILSVVGFVWIFDYLKTKKYILLISLISLLSFIYVFDSVKFADYYLVHYPVELSEYRQYGWKQTAVYAYSVRDHYDNIYIDPRIGTEGPYTYGIPYLYFLFYSQYDPIKFHNRPNADKFVSDFENFHFQEINWESVNKKGNNLYVGSPWTFPQSIMNDKYIVHKELFLNGKSGIYVVTNIPKNEKTQQK